EQSLETLGWNPGGCGCCGNPETRDLASVENQFNLFFSGSSLVFFFFPLPGAGGWSPMVTDKKPWLQVDLREQKEVTAVATQGRYNSSDWVSRYLLLHSDTGQAWKRYRQDDSVWRFVGNMNSEAAVQNKLSHSVKTRFLRFVPLDWNPSGWLGLRVEVYGCFYKSDVADFDGRSSLLYRFNQKSMSTMKDVISLRFKSRQAEGVLLHGEGQRGDYITLELHRGRLALYLNLGESPFSSRVAVTVGSLLDDQHWHSVVIERFNKQVNLTMDSHTQHFQTKGEGDSLEVDYELSFGGIPLPGKPGTFLRKNFHGCIENLYYNGINIIDLAKRRKPQIYTVGNVTFSCSWPHLPACTFLSSSSSFLLLPAAAPSGLMAGFSVCFQFRTWNSEGLLLSVQLSRDCSVFILNDVKYFPLSPGYRVNDGLWHSKQHQNKSRVVCVVLQQVMIMMCHLHPGCPPAACQNLTLAFQGCIRLISINGQQVNLNHVQQRLLGIYNGLQFDTCNIRDRCLPNLCEHGGQCGQSWSSFSCDCSGTDYSGATCHNSIYETSCTAYKLIGSSSGLYTIDPDGSGPLGPTEVYCNMTEERVWTVMTHNVTAPVRVQGSSLQHPHIMKLKYSASAEQMRSIIMASEQCQQEVVYSCKKSRLFNTKDGHPLSWWLDQRGDRRSYWGGFLPGVQQCSCSLEENCIDMNYFCNCDADKASANDSGVLSYKEHLPVSHVVIGDTNRTGSEAIYQIGPLRCYGDKSIWNAVSFYQESSSLLFPTLQGELTCDISFYFKTSVRSGVLLENLGHKDFIRVELSSPSVVTFSFDVGNGPVVLAVKSHLPLNDRQWHYVRVERNMKEASLQVDQLPLHFLEAPADGHCRLRLNNQLFVEVSVSFDTESSVTFTFQEPFSVMQNRSSQTSGVSRESSSRSREDVAFSFITSHSPAMLLTVSTFSQQYMAIILARNGSLQIWYHLQTHRKPDMFIPILSSLADGQLHHIRIHHEGKDLYVQVSSQLIYFCLSQPRITSQSLTLGKVIRGDNCLDEVVEAGSRGFIGCLSSVQFNHMAPLKALLLNRGSSLVTVRGPLVQSNCGALADSIKSHNLRGVSTAVVFIVVCVLAVVTHLLYRRWTQRSNKSIKEKEHCHGNRKEIHINNSLRDNMKEYYI
uniref:Contactin-associated protein-like 5 n=1 Tax=Seriola dumerili TaxID=41447 RepID=A0A3B4VIB6_SERDU